MKNILAVLFLGVFCTCTYAQFDPNYNRVIFWHNQLLMSINSSQSSIFWLGEYQHAALSLAMHETLTRIGCKKTSRCNMALANLSVDVVGQYVLKHYYPNGWIGFEDILHASFGAQPDASIKERAKKVGESEAKKAIVAVDAKSEIFKLDEYHFAVGVEGRYQRTPPFFKIPSLQQYATAEPLVLPDPGFFIAPPIPPISGNRYKQDVDEVRIVGAVNSTTRTLYQTRLARYMDGGNFGGNPESAIGTFTRIAEQLIKQTNKNMYDTAAVMRVLTTACFDRDMAHMYNKRFIFDSWRPVTVIRNGAPSNPNIVVDPNWTPLLFYNSNQEYPAGHPSMSMCAIHVFRRLFGRDNFAFVLPSGHAEYPLFTFNNLTHFLEDSTGARIWAGLHFRFSALGAWNLGEQVCGYIYEQLCEDGSCFSRP